MFSHSIIISATALENNACADEINEDFMTKRNEEESVEKYLLKNTEKIKRKK